MFSFSTIWSHSGAWRVQNVFPIFLQFVEQNLDICNIKPNVNGTKTLTVLSKTLKNPVISVIAKIFSKQSLKISKPWMLPENPLLNTTLIWGVKASSCFWYFSAVSLEVPRSPAINGKNLSSILITWSMVWRKLSARPLLVNGPK